MNNFRRIKQSLRTFAKRCKDLHYTDDLLITFLITGTLFTTVNAFSAVESTSIESQRQVISTSIRGIQQELKKTKAENNKLLKNTNLELIQLMEQGDHVTKSPWSSWQYGMNYFYNDWRGTFRGRGDKKQKYPYEGIFERSDDIFLRSISSDSVHYDSYTSAANALGKYRHPATTSSNQVRSRYGLENSEIRYEPVVRIELGASVKPKEIVKSPVTVTPPRIQVNTVTPLSTPAAPSAPNPPTIEIDKFNPVAPNPITVDLPTPPTFNIKLGSYRNYMTQNFLGDVDGGRHTGDGKSYGTSDSPRINGADLGNSTVIYAWATPSGHVPGAKFDSALLKAYFDYTYRGGSGGGTATVEGDVRIDSIRGNIQDPDPVNRPWNNQPFLVGGSRIATLDNAQNGGTILNKATVRMIGPLVVGYEIQNDDAGTGKREVINSEVGGTLTDESEPTDAALNGVFGNNSSLDLNLAPNLGGKGTGTYGQTKITVKKGYTGYKVGMILTHEKDDPSPTTNYYRLINNGVISFKGDSSIGIQVYAPPAGAPNTVVQVINGESVGGNKIISLGGIKSYGLKLSSRILEGAGNNKSKFENRGQINISGGNGEEQSLSSGIAVLEDNSMQGTKAIRAYNNLVKNVNGGTIHVLGGQGNSGMVLKVKANDDITNTENAKIRVTGTKNIGMRVDLGAVTTDDPATTFTPKAINKGTITINDDQAGSTGNIGMVANNSDGKSKAVAENVYLAKINFTGKSTKAIGMFSQNGGEILNKGEITGGSTKAKLEGTLGMVVQPADAKKNMVASSGINDDKGKIDLTGNKVTGVYNQGTFVNKGKIATSGEGAITLYAKGKDSVTDIYSGTITAKNKALGLFADGATVKLGTGGSKALTLEADGEGTLMFYNYTKTVTGGVTNYSNTDGKFSLQNDVTAELKNGATGFYFRDTTPGSGSGTTTASQLNSMFGGSVSGKKLKMSLDEHSTLFVLDNKSPNKTAVNLSDVDPDAINKHLGNHVEVSGKNYKAYKVSKGTLNVNKDVNLDNHTSVGGSKIDDYYRVEFINSSVTVAKNQTISGTDAGKLDQVIAQANFEGATKSDTIQVTNNGTINYSKKGATAVVVDFGQATNNGLIKMDAANGSTETSVGLFGASNSILKNSSTGEIQLGKNGVGIWGKNNIKSSVSTWSKNINIENAGKITGLAGKENIFGIYADNSKVARADSKVFHSGTIDLS
jgi:fusobacterium outer membrane protein (fragment)